MKNVTMPRQDFILKCVQCIRLCEIHDLDIRIINHCNRVLKFLYEVDDSLQVTLSFEDYEIIEQVLVKEDWNV